MTGEKPINHTQREESTHLTAWRPGLQTWICHFQLSALGRTASHVGFPLSKMSRSLGIFALQCVTGTSSNGKPLKSY